VASVFSSHPDESNIVKKIIATNVERSVVFMRLTRIEQIGNLRDGRDSARDKPRLALNNITAGVREGEDANRRVAGHLDEIQDVVANTLNLIRNRAGGFIGSLDTGVAIAFASVELGIYQECEQNANPEPPRFDFV
jgi:hypothetical protein